MNQSMKSMRKFSDEMGTASAISLQGPATQSHLGVCDLGAACSTSKFPHFPQGLLLTSAGDRGWTLLSKMVSISSQLDIVLYHCLTSGGSICWFLAGFMIFFKFLSTHKDRISNTVMA